MIEVEDVVSFLVPPDLTENEIKAFSEEVSGVLDIFEQQLDLSYPRSYPNALISFLNKKSKALSTILTNPIEGNASRFASEFTKVSQDSFNEKGIWLTIPANGGILVLRTRDEIVGFISHDFYSDFNKLVIFILEENKDKVLSTLNEIDFNYQKSIGRSCYRMKSDGGRIGKTLFPRVKRNLEVKPELFWPSFTQTPRELFESFLKSDATVLILYGEPGLGKTQFIHELLDCMRKGEVYSNDNKDVFNHPDFIEFLVGLKENDIFITEDGMEMLRKREDGNSTMVGVLNATQGLNSSGSKFIISTNYTDLKDIDPALIRPGRTYRAIEFKKLTVEQANELRAAYERPVVDFGDKKSLTLAEALNWEDFIETESQRRSFGFNS